MVLKKVLIVDDSPAQVKLMQGLLDHEGYQSFGLNDPRRIEETIASYHPSLILLDVVMPERNGFQVCRELKGSAEFQSIPVILVSSKDTPSDKYWGEQQGADGETCRQISAFHCSALPHCQGNCIDKVRARSLSPAEVGCFRLRPC